MTCPAFPSGLYRTILADPPWRYSEKVAVGDGPQHKGPDAVYRSMTLADILALPVPDVVHPGGAHLYLWTTQQFLEDAHDVCRAWGFTPRNILTWVKYGRGLGLGYHFRTTTEFILFATTKGAPRTVSRSVPTHFAWAQPREHSRKPVEQYHLIEQMSPGPYLELFARPVVGQERPGWTYWGMPTTGYRAARTTERVAA